jgi:hypothetical protein
LFIYLLILFIINITPITNIPSKPEIDGVIVGTGVGGIIGTTFDCDIIGVAVGVIIGCGVAVGTGVGITGDVLIFTEGSFIISVPTMFDRF